MGSPTRGLWAYIIPWCLVVSNWDELDTWSFLLDITRHLATIFCLRRLEFDIWKNFVGGQTSLDACRGRPKAGRKIFSAQMSKIRHLEDFFGSLDITRHLAKFFFGRPKNFCPLYQLSYQVGSIFYIRGQRLKSLQSCFHNACFIWFLVC